jgi:hypothetical protein
MMLHVIPVFSSCFFQQLYMALVFPVKNCIFATLQTIK